MAVCLQMQASTGLLQSGQCRPASVENTKPPRAEKDEAFLTTGLFLGQEGPAQRYVVDGPESDWLTKVSAAKPHSGRGSAPGPGDSGLKGGAVYREISLLLIANLRH
jgi:hypothetical protein